MKIKQEQINLLSLMRILLPFNWQRDCEIEEINVLSCPTLRVLVRHKDQYLRYSHGPKQGYFWDCYGDDFQNTSLALLALHDAPPPPNWKSSVYDVIGVI